MKHVMLCAVTLCLLLVACGSDEVSSVRDAGRTVDILMVDERFAPRVLEVDEGEVVRLVFSNAGSVTHEAILGDEDAQLEHEREMSDGGPMAQGGHATAVEPGQTRELVFEAKRVGTTLIGCHEPGHYEDGMRAAITVT